jgi:hypothetical protein
MTRPTQVSEIKRIMESLESIDADLKSKIPDEKPQPEDLLVDEVPPEQEEHRQSIAKIIDPVAWDSHPYNTQDHDQLISLDKADQIMSYLNMSDNHSPLSEDASSGATGAGSIASVATPYGKTISREPNLFGYIKQAEKKMRKKRGK